MENPLTKSAVNTVFPPLLSTIGTVRRCGHKYSNMDTDELRKLKALEAENARLKKMFAFLSIDHQILKEGYAILKKL